MRVFRLSKKKYATTLSGKGASKSGNRWNSIGTEMIYTAESRALAMAEVAVHVTLATLPSDYSMIEIEIPDTLKIKEISIQDLPDNWNHHPPNRSTQKIGDEFIDSDECLLKVPSAVVQGDFNILINPYPKEFKKIKIISVVAFPFDKRIFE
ncbi:MAG: RES family NAD+ phosphorylase [Cyclobacterium sp.]|uniref:RES family NAD+ phosphorylase n=1 Tax=Cyclobacterium sp. TaxID=1966343 RepID=UPI003970DCA7